MMTRHRYRLRALLCCFCAVLSVFCGRGLLAAAGRGEGGELGEEMSPEQTEIRRITVKRYAEVAPTVVSRLVREGKNDDVRFSDSVTARARASSSVRRVSIGERNYRIAFMFRTSQGLVCLVPAEQQDTITKVRNFREEQVVTVEGTVLGTIGTWRTVVVDRVLTGEGEKSEIEYELEFSWPRYRGAEPQTINEPGEHTVTFPCRYDREEQETATILVERLGRKEFEERLREARRKTEEAERQEEEEQEQEQEKEGEKKEYNTFAAQTVYRRINDEEIINVRFRERVKDASARRPDSMPVPGGGRVRVGAAFETYLGITCFVPADKEDLVRRANQLVEGQSVEIRGTTLPRRGIYRPVVVDKLIPAGGAQREDEMPYIWLVRVFWGDEKPRVFYRTGLYHLDFPCTHVDGRVERLDARLREVRVIKGKVEEETE